MRFELTKDMIDALKKGNGLSMGVEHSAYCHSLELSDNSRESLINTIWINNLFYMGRLVGNNCPISTQRLSPVQSTITTVNKLY